MVSRLEGLLEIVSLGMTTFGVYDFLLVFHYRLEDVTNFVKIKWVT